MGRPRVMVALLAGGLVATACGSAGETATTVAPAVQVNRFDSEVPLHRTHEGPALVVDRSDPDLVYLGHVEMATGACRFSVSRNQGATWREAEAPELAPFTDNCAMGQAQPQNLRTELQQGPDGTLFFVFQANAADRNGTRSVMLGRSRDGGLTWQTVPIDAGAVAPEPGREMEVNFQGHIALDPANPDRIYAMWRRSFRNFPESLPTRPFMAVSDDGGSTWSSPRMMFEKNNGFDGPRPVVVGDELWAFYRESAAPAATGQPPNPTILFAAVSTDEGVTWTDHEIIRARDASEPVPFYDRERGRFYVVWHDNRAEELDAYFASSTDGRTWSSPAMLNDDAPGRRVGQHYPQISMSPDGRIDVAWYDWRDDPFPAPAAPANGVLSLFSNRGRMASVYLTSSSDGGSTWTSNLRVSDVLIDRTVGTWMNNADVMAPVSLASADNHTVVAWSDTRNGNALNQTQDIYTATVALAAASASEVTPLGAGIVGGLLGMGLAMCLAYAILRRSKTEPGPPLASVREPQRVG